MSKDRIIPKDFCPSGLVVDVKNFSSRNIPSVNKIKHFANTVLKAEKINTAELFILVVRRSFMKRLNKKFLSKNTPTDVLSFDVTSSLSLPRRCLKADIVVSVDAALRSAKLLRISFKEELYRYIIHGILHLAGYDDTTAAQKKRMWKRQEFLLKKLKVIR